MHEIFINYRTKGGKDLAFRCQQALTDRFGPHSVFLAGDSIELGADFIETLPQAVRRSRVLLAIIDENWLDAPDPRRTGRRALTNPQDWVRRELEEAFDSGVLVVPVLTGRTVEQIPPHRLPKSIAQLASCQYARVQARTFDTDLTGLGDRLAHQVPGLAVLDNKESENNSEPEGTATFRSDHQSGGIGQVGGSVGTFVNESRGPLHSGSGDLVHHENGDGTMYVAGDSHGGGPRWIGPRSSRALRDDEQ